MEIKIPKPCNENWDNMVSDENGRFCKNCNKSVINFRGFNDKQLYNFFQQTKANVCGNFTPEQINRSLFINNSERGFWLSKPIFSLLVLLGLNKEINAQNLKDVPLTIQKIEPKPLPSLDNFSINGNRKISGVVSDINNKLLANVNVWVKEMNKRTYTNNDGNFKLNFNLPDVNKGVTIVFSIPGYQNIEFKSSFYDDPLSIQMMANSSSLKGKVCIIQKETYSAIVGGAVAHYKPTLKSRIKNLFKKKYRG